MTQNAQPAPSHDASARRSADAACIARVRAGDADAYGELVERHFYTVFSCAYQLLHSRDDAEEMAQEAFVQGFRKLHQLREPQYFLSWIWRVCTSLALRYRERSSRQRLGLVDDDRPSEPEITNIELDERSQALLHALSELPDDQREVIALRYWQDMSYETMSDMLGVSVDALYQRASRGLKRMRALLGDDFLAE